MRTSIFAYTLLACIGGDKPTETDSNETGTTETATTETGQTSESGHSGETGITLTGETGNSGGPTLTTLDRLGYCDGGTGCVYHLEVSDVPSGTWTVSLPSARQVDATGEVVVS